MSSAGNEQAGKAYAWLLGLPDDPEAIELGQRLQHIKSQDPIKQRVTMCALIEYADNILHDGTEQAA